MAERHLPAAKVRDVLGHKVGAGDVIAAAFTDFGSPALRVGKVLAVLDRTRPGADQSLALLVRWQIGSQDALMPSRTSRIDARLRRFIRVPVDLPEPPPPAPSPPGTPAGSCQPTLEESL